jgi:hypothetical protein
MPVLETAQDVERAFGLAPSSSEGGGKPPLTPPQVAAAATPAQPAPGFRFIADRLTLTLRLLYPFEVNGIEYHEYTLRRLNAEEVAEVGQVLRSTGDMAALYSAVCGLPFIACKHMDADDAEALASAALDFMPATLRALLEKN